MQTAASERKSNIPFRKVRTLRKQPVDTAWACMVCRRLDSHKNTVWYANRFIGRQLGSPDLEQELKLLPFSKMCFRVV